MLVCLCKQHGLLTECDCVVIGLFKQYIVVAFSSVKIASTQGDIVNLHSLQYLNYVGCCKQFILSILRRCC